MTTIALAAVLLAACSDDTEEPEGADPAPVTTEDAGEAATESSGDEDAGATTDDDQDEETQTGAADDAAETGASDDPAAETGSSDEDVIEVGEGAAFLTPDSNIVCVLGEEGEGQAFCDIWASADPIDVIEEADCSEEQRPLLVLSGGEVSGDCSDDLVSVEADVNAGGDWIGDGPTIDIGVAMAAILEDGQTLRGATHECTVVGRDTVTCQDVAGEHGFTLSMSSYETW